MPEKSGRFNVADEVLLREVWEGRIWTARPVRVVRDSPELLVLHMQPGTVCMHPTARNGSPVPHFLPDDWLLTDKTWTGGDALYLCPAGAWHMVILFFSAPPERRLLNWYVNLQTPLVRTAIGFDYLDQELDLVISPDLKAWEWKDEDRFVDAVARKRIPAERVTQLHDEGERVIDQLDRPGSIFHQGWDRWSPPWSEPATLPLGWDRVVEK